MSNINVYPILIKWKSNQLGEAPIGINIDLDNKRIALKQIKHQKIPVDQWDEKRRQVKFTFPNASLINTLIDKDIAKHRTFFLKREAFDMPINNEIIKLYLNSDSSMENFYEYALTVIDTKLLKDGKPFSEDSKRRYRDEVRRAIEFQEVLYFHQLDAKWLSSYKEWLQNTHLKKDKTKLHPNSIWKAFSFIRMIYNYAIKKGVISPAVNPFTQFEVGSCEVDMDKIKYLERHEVDALEKVLIEKRDLIPDLTYRIGWRFLSMCVLGMRISDAMYLDEAYFNDAGDLEFTPYKTRRHGNKAQVPITAERQKRYIQMTLQNKLSSTDHKSFRTTFNINLKILAPLAGIKINLTSHIGRHTTGSFLVDGNVENRSAKAILGVKSDKVMEIYLHLKQNKLRSEAEKLGTAMD